MTANNLNNWFNIYFTSDSKIEYNTSFVLSLIKYLKYNACLLIILYKTDPIYMHMNKSQNYINIIISYKYFTCSPF